MFQRSNLVATAISLFAIGLTMAVFAERQILRAELMIFSFTDHQNGVLDFSSHLAHVLPDQTALVVLAAIGVIGEILFMGGIALAIISIGLRYFVHHPKHVIWANSPLHRPITRDAV